LPGALVRRIALPMSRPPIFDVSGWVLNLLRRLLYLVTRTQVFPESPAALGLRSDRAVCYVLHEQHLANLLVLDHECRRLGLPPALRPMRDEAFSAPRSYFFLSRNLRGNIVPTRASTTPRCSSRWSRRPSPIRGSTSNWCR
jgi:glycerol-3-phosphate O-acyltransferase